MVVVDSVNAVISMIEQDVENSPSEDCISITSQTQEAICHLASTSQAIHNDCPCTRLYGNSMYVVYNFDIPVNRMYNVLVNGNDDSIKPCVCDPTPHAWPLFDLPPIDNLCNDIAPLYTWYAWFTIMKVYVQNALQTNQVNKDNAGGALEQVQFEINFSKKDIQTHRLHQQKEDMLDAAAECPQACMAVAQQEFEDQAAYERSGRARKYGDVVCSQRKRRKKRHIYIPIDRKPKSDLQHYLTDCTYERKQTDLKRRVSHLEERYSNIEKMQVLAKNIRDVLIKASCTFDHILNNLKIFIDDWICALEYLPNGPSITRKLEFQRQFKVQLLDLKTFMTTQTMDGCLLLGENRQGGLFKYSFPYAVNDCNLFQKITAPTVFIHQAKMTVKEHGFNILKSFIPVLTTLEVDEHIDAEDIQQYLSKLRFITSFLSTAEDQS